MKKIILFFLLFFFALNSSAQKNLAWSEVNNSIDFYNKRLKFEQDSTRNVQIQEEERGKLLTQLVSAIRPFYINDSIYVDSAYNVVIQKINGADNVMESARNFILTGFKTNISGPYSDGQKNDLYFLSLGVYQDINNANNALNLIKPLFPDSELHYLVMPPGWRNDD